MRAATALALVLLVPPALAAGEVVDVVEVRAPERTLAGLRFEADVVLRNKAAARQEVVLLAALYARDGEACGPAGEPGFRQFTHLVQETLDLAPGETRTIEGFANRYARDKVGAAPEAAEWCVFVARDAGERIEYLDLEAVPLSVRGENARPAASFSWSPERPVAAEDVRFTAVAEDADGDPVTFSWDFGHANASGRVPALGPVAGHFFFPAGRYTVTLTASDGLEEAQVAREVEVVAAAPTPEARDRVPLPLILPLAALGAAARARGRRPRCP